MDRFASAWPLSTDAVKLLTNQLSNSVEGRFVKDTLGYLPAAVVPALLGLVATYVFTRIFNPQEYGRYSLGLAIITPMVTLFAEWIAQPAARYFAEFASLESQSVYYAVIRRLLLVMLVLVFAVASVASLFLSVSGRLVGQMPFLISVLVAILAQSFFVVSIRILPVHDKIQAYRNALILSSALSLAISWILVLFAGHNVLWLIVGYALSMIILLPYTYRQAGFGTYWRQRSASADDVRQAMRRFVRYGTPLVLWFFAMGLLSLGDRYVIQIFLGPQELGIYSVSYNLVAQAAALVSVPFMTAILPVLTKQWANSDFGLVEKTMTQVTSLYLVVGFALIGGMTALARPLVELLVGPGFQEGYTIILPVAAGVVVYGAAVIGQKSVELAERTRVMVLLALVAASANIAMNLVFVPRLGYMGAAITTFLSYLLYAFLIWSVSRRYVPWRIELKRAGTAAVFALIACSMSLWCLTAISDSPLQQIIVGSIVYLVLYCSLTLISFRRHIFASRYS